MTLPKSSKSKCSLPILSSVVMAVVSLTTIIQRAFLSNSSQLSKHDGVFAQLVHAIIYRNMAAPQFGEKFRGRHAGELGGAPQRNHLPLVKADGDVHHGVAFIQHDVAEPLRWNRQSHIAPKIHPKTLIWQLPSANLF